MTERPSRRGLVPTGNGETWLEGERRFARWLQERFPGDLTVEQRRSRVLRRKLRLTAPVVLLWIVLMGFVDPATKRRIVEVPAVRPWHVALWVLAALTVVGAVVVAVRLRPRLAPGVERGRVLDVLDRDQRRELVAELRGRRPVVPGDEWVLRRLAAERLDGSMVGGLAAGVVLALLPAELTDPSGPTGALRAGLLLVVVALGVEQVRGTRQGIAYLRGRDGSG
jgi:hypothetical protein